jgi:UDP-N-acetylglucosamine--N-acetylmuramyl-(pentapeptide) pyrophosphoryl-undecaprenol N-acetylglucosamine transferase
MIRQIRKQTGEQNSNWMVDGKKYRILIGGGGTGGHVFPAIAIADALKKAHPQTEFLFVGARGRLEMEKVPEAGYKIQGLPVAGFQRRLTLKNISFFFKLASSLMISRRIIRQFNPQMAIGVGGYASGPILKAASRRGIPILIQEQNSYAGVTNRLLARSAKIICVAYENMERYFPSERLVLTGNPIRQHLVTPSGNRVEDLKEFELEEGKKTCLVVGGSLGARTLNRSLMDGLKKLDRNDIQVIWQCGKYYKDEVMQFVDSSGMKHIKVMPFISKMECAYNVADVIVSRAGAITISELCVIGKPAILVPSPNVAEDHQTHNANALVSRQAAVMIPDGEAPEKLVDSMLDLAFNDTIKADLAENIKQLAIPDAAARIASEAIKLLKLS